jgi:hypothetical protein
MELAVPLQRNLRDNSQCFEAGRTKNFISFEQHLKRVGIVGRVGLMVSALDSDSGDPGSNLGVAHETDA